MVDDQELASSKALQDLKEAVTPEIIDLIRRQRLRYLTEGMVFPKFVKNQRSKNNFWYCRLSPNHKILHYGDCQENQNPGVDELTKKLAISEVAAMVTGKDCPHVKDAKNKKSVVENLSFSLYLKETEDEPLNFLAPNDQVYNRWTDGLNALLGKEMTSPEAKHDFDVLLNMEIKIRLLDVFGGNDMTTIPDTPLPVPPPPANFDFTLRN